MLIKKLILQMNISFSQKKLQKIANDDRLSKKELGELRAKKLKLRLSELTSADTLEDTRYLAGHYHELKNDRKGQWACDLDQPYRLIFEPHENPIPTNEDGQYIWIEIIGVEIIEIVNYH
jgi:proteic killer suppression protein